MISLHTDSHRIPFAHIDVIFSFRLMEPSPAIGFIDSSTMMSRRCHFYLPATDRNFILNKRTEEYAAVSISFLKKIYLKIEIIVIHIGRQITILFIRSAFTDHFTIFHIPQLRSVFGPSGQISSIEKLHIFPWFSWQLFDLHILEPGFGTMILKNDVPVPRQSILPYISPFSRFFSLEPIG